MEDLEKEDIIIDKKDSKQNETKIKIKEYFDINKSLTKNNFNNFLNYIGLGQIWSTDDEQNILWDKVSMYSVDKKNIDYEAALCGINDFFEEEDDDNDISDENNKLSDNDLLSDIDLQSLHTKSKFLEEDEIKKENSNDDNIIDEFINDISNNEGNLYAIRFINEISFSKYLNAKENDIENNNLNCANKNDIINEIQTKYKFINISNEILHNYFNYISKNIIDEKDKFIIDKTLIEYTNSIINKKINNKKITITSLNLNQNLSNDNKTVNKISTNIEKLVSLDSNIIECIKSIVDLRDNKNFVELGMEYIEKYISKLKDSIYKEMKNKENEYEQKLLNSCNNNNNDTNLEEENKKLKAQIEYLIKENLTLSKDIEDIKSKNENIGLNSNKELNKIKITNEISKNRDELVSPSKNSINLQNNPQKNKNKIFIPPLKLKEQINHEIENSNVISTEQSKEISYIKNTNSNSKAKILLGKSPNKLQTVGTNSFNDLCEDLTNSHQDIFSLNLNNITTDQFLLDTTRLCNEGEDINKNNEKDRYSISNNSKIINTNSNKDYKINNYLYEDTSVGLSRIRDNNDKDEYYDDYFEDDLDIDINKKSRYNRVLTEHYLRNSNIQNNDLLDENENNDNNINNVNRVNTNYYKAQSFFNNHNNLLKKKIKYTNEDIFYGYMNKAIKDFYDFNYLSKNHKISKILSKNKEKLINKEFLSNQINAYINSLKKKKCIIIITYQTFYFLKNEESYECILKLNIKSLESIIISAKHFNLLQLSFNGGIDIIIESYQRIDILTFLQNLIEGGKFNKNLKISSSNDFYFHKKNGTLEKVPTLKNKIFQFTPNFENAQKIGVLLKYKENIFSGSFHEKLIVLSSIGLMYFDENSKIPKDIIPVIGTTIKFIVVQVNKKIYCFKMKTINNEVYIFGSFQKKEIFDWLKELAHFKKVYHLKMKHINPNFVSQNSNEISNDVNLIKNNELNENIFS